jgi:hypothetical protein
MRQQQRPQCHECGSTSITVIRDLPDLVTAAHIVFDGEQCPVDDHKLCRCENGHEFPVNFGVLELATR